MREEGRRMKEREERTGEERRGKEMRGERRMRRRKEDRKGQDRAEKKREITRPGRTYLQFHLFGNLRQEHCILSQNRKRRRLLGTIQL